MAVGVNGNSSSNGSDIGGVGGSVKSNAFELITWLVIKDAR